MGTIRQILWWGQLAGCYIFVFFSPFSIAGAQIGLVAALICWLLDFIFEIPRPFPARFIAFPVLVYIASVFGAALFGMNVKSSFSSLVELWLFLPLFLFSQRLTDSLFRRRLFDVLIFSSGVIALYAILQHFTGWHPHRPEPLDPIGNHFRSVGTFSTPLTFGLYFTLIAAVCFCLGWKQRHQVREKWYLLVAALSFLAVLFSAGRAAQLSLGVGLCFVLLFLKSKEKKQVLAAGLVLTLAAFLSSPEIFNRFEQFKNYEFSPEALNSRLAIWKRCYEIFWQHPIIGIGYGNFIGEYEKLIVGTSAKIVGHAHNDFINVAVHTGIVGLSAFLFFWWIVGVHIWKAFRKSPERPSNIFLLAGLLSLLLYLFYAQFEASFFDQEIQMVLFFILSASFSISIRPES